MIIGTKGITFLPGEKKMQPAQKREAPEKQSESLASTWMTLPAVSQTVFRSALSHFSSGITIVTTCDDGHFHGLTVSSFCSLSLEPPLVLICIDHRCQSHVLIEKTRIFAVNILAENGRWLAHQFAQREKERFMNVATYIGLTGAPMLRDALATIECQVCDILPGGDHSVIVGRVVNAHINDEALPLLYYRSEFYQLAALRQQKSSSG